MSTIAAGRFRLAPALTAVVLTVLLLWLLGTAADVFLLLFIAVLISLYLSAGADVIQRHTGAPRLTAFWITVAVSLLALVALFWTLVPPVVEQTQQLIRVLPETIVKWETGLERVIARFPALQAVMVPGEHRVLVAVYEQISGYFNDVLPKLASVLHGAINVFAVAVMALYVALHPGLYRERLIVLFPPVHRDLVRNVFSDLGRMLRAWLVGQMIAMLLLAVLTAAGLYLLKVPYWLTFGVFTGLAAIVPFFGSLVSTILPALFVISGPGGFTHALGVIALGVGVHIFEANIVLPKIMHKQVHLPPVLTVLAVLLMGKLLGPIGLIVAVPVLVIVDVVVRRILINRIYEGQGFRRSTRDSALVMRVPAPPGSVLLPSNPVDVVTLSESRREQQAA